MIFKKILAWLRFLHLLKMFPQKDHFLVKYTPNGATFLSFCFEQIFLKIRLSCLPRGRLEISRNVKFIVVAPGASKLRVFKEVCPSWELNPDLPHGLINIWKMLQSLWKILQSLMYTQKQKVISYLVRILRTSQNWSMHHSL